MKLIDYAIERFLDHRRYIAAIRHDGVVTNDYDPYFDKARDAVRAVNIEFGVDQMKQLLRKRKKT